MSQTSGPVVQWLSSDINIFEPVFLLRVRIPEFFFSLFFLFLTPSVGSLNYLALNQTVADPKGVQWASEMIISF